MNSKNPALTAGAFTQFDDYAMSGAKSTTMTVGGTAIKGLILLGLAMATATITWTEFQESGLGQVMPWFLGCAIGGLVVALITTFKPQAAPYTGPLYAALEGVVLGTLTVIAENRFPGIAFQAIATTFGLFFVMMVLYTSRTIRVTPGLQKGLMAAIIAIALLYLVSFLLRMFGVTVPFLGQPNPIGIGISVVIVGVAAFALLLDFHAIEQAVNAGAPKSMEWYGAFGLMVGLVWLYIEVLRLLMLIASYANSGD